MFNIFKCTRQRTPCYKLLQGVIAGIGPDINSFNNLQQSHFTMTCKMRQSPINKTDWIWRHVMWVLFKIYPTRACCHTHVPLKTNQSTSSLTVLSKLQPFCHILESTFLYSVSLSAARQSRVQENNTTAQLRATQTTIHKNDHTVNVGCQGDGIWGAGLGVSRYRVYRLAI